MSAFDAMMTGARKDKGAGTGGKRRRVSGGALKAQPTVAATAAKATLAQLGFDADVVATVLNGLDAASTSDDALLDLALAATAARSTQTQPGQETPGAVPPPKHTPVALAAAAARPTQPEQETPEPVQPPKQKPPRQQQQLKKGQSLASFFGGADNRVPPVYMLYWDLSTNPTTPTAHFLPDVPTGAHVVGEIKWRQAKRNVTLCCSASAAHSAWCPPAEREYSKGAEQLLKSHLQKCVRRSLPVLAVDTAAHLMRLNMSELLQRTYCNDIALCSPRVRVLCSQGVCTCTEVVGLCYAMRMHIAGCRCAVLSLLASGLNCMFPSTHLHDVYHDAHCISCTNIPILSC